jgi:SAM-dependent methyltransferase
MVEINEIDWKEDSQSFNSVASLYDAYRPDYPKEMIDSLISLTGIPQGGRILEIGSGTGKATVLFAQRGFSMLCIEPGENLAALAAQTLRGFSHITFESTHFEDWEIKPAEFDMTISAQAFHWIPKDVGYAKAAQALKTRGHLALFWNMYPGMEGQMASDLKKAYQEFAPEMTNREESFEDTIKQRENDIVESGCFGLVTMKRFPWSARYTTGQYLGLLNTYSDHLRLPKPTRDRLLAGIARIIDKQGGYIEWPYVTVLYIAQKVS